MRRIRMLLALLVFVAGSGAAKECSEWNEIDPGSNNSVGVATIYSFRKIPEECENGNHIDLKRVKAEERFSDKGEHFVRITLIHDTGDCRIEEPGTKFIGTARKTSGGWIIVGSKREVPPSLHDKKPSH